MSLESGKKKGVRNNISQDSPKKVKTQEEKVRNSEKKWLTDIKKSIEQATQHEAQLWKLLADKNELRKEHVRLFDLIVTTHAQIQQFITSDELLTKNKDLVASIQDIVSLLDTQRKSFVSIDKLSNDQITQILDGNKQGQNVSEVSRKLHALIAYLDLRYYMLHMHID